MMIPLDLSASHRVSKRNPEVDGLILSETGLNDVLPGRHRLRGLSRMNAPLLDDLLAAPKPTAVLILETGEQFFGQGFGAETTRAGEICFNTSMSGYQEILTDPSYAGQIITFTAPHIGIVGCNSLDLERDSIAALGLITRVMPGKASSHRAETTLADWCSQHGLAGIAGIDTRALTHRIRSDGAISGVLCHRRDGVFDIPQLEMMVKKFGSLAGKELASEVSLDAPVRWRQGIWQAETNSYSQSGPAASDRKAADAEPENTTPYHVIALDYGCKNNILRCLVEHGCCVELMPIETTAETILAAAPDGVFLSNGPGDPAATAKLAAQTIETIALAGIPVFGICIGHQLIAEAFGARTFKMFTGHRGANHPVKDLIDGRIEITSQNHGFAVCPETIPDCLEVTHLSLFDGSIEGLRHRQLPVFSVQYHPESSPGPHDSRHLFGRFVRLMAASMNKSEASAGNQTGDDDATP